MGRGWETAGVGVGCCCGWGKVVGSTRCDLCNGKGRVSRDWNVLGASRGVIWGPKSVE